MQSSIFAPQGTNLGLVMPPATLADWNRIATGDGREVWTKSGACFHRPEGSEDVSADLAWDAVGAYFEGLAA